MSISQQLRVLVVDDSIVYRKILTYTLNGHPNLRVVGSAQNGKLALEKVSAMQPDLITLDIEMPEMNGIETLRALQVRYPQADIIMVSALTQAGARETIKSLELGAFGFIAKPDTSNPAASAAEVKSQLDPLVESLIEKKTGRAAAPPPTEPKKPRAALTSAKPGIVALGVSTGGPNALAEVIPKMPGTLHVPMVIVQHMPPMFTASLAQSLATKSEVAVKEGENGEPLKPGTVYLAPGGRHMVVKRLSSCSGVSIGITDDPPENNCKPAADVLFRSVAKEFGKRALGVIMTGMGTDGTKGLQRMKRFGVKVIGQDRETSVVYGMPGEAMKAGVVDIESPLKDIARQILMSL